MGSSPFSPTTEETPIDEKTTRNRRSHRLAGWFLIILTSCVVLALFWVQEWYRTGGQIGVPLDDAWIHFRFADNLLHGYGFSYNRGEPTPGSTAPLWTLLLAGARWITGEFLFTAKFLSAVGLVGSGLALYEYAYRRTSKPRLALAAGILTVCTGRLVWAGMSGMEASWFTLLSILAVDRHERNLKPSCSRFWPALLFGLASQFRPEGHALFGLALLDDLSANWSQKPEGERRARTTCHLMARLSKQILVYLLVSAPYALFAYATTHHVLPNTFIAKATPGPFSFRLVADYIRTLLWNDNPIVGLLLPIGWAIWFTSMLASRSRRETSSSLLLPAWALLLPLLMAFLNTALGHHGRYLMPLIPFNLLIALSGLDGLSSWLGKQSARASVTNRFAKAIPLLIWGAGLTVALATATFRSVQWADRLASDVDNVNSMQVALGRWAADNLPANATLALDDIGAITFLSNRRILDMWGLVSPEVWPIIHKPSSRDRDLSMLRLLSQQKVDYVFMFPNWHSDLLHAQGLFTPLHQVQVEHNTILGGPEMIVYQPDWPYVARPTISRPLAANWNGMVELEGFDLLPKDGLEPGEEAQLTLYWECLAPMQVDYMVFVHLVNDAEQIYGQHDGQPVDAMAPTTFWQPGDIVRDKHKLLIQEGTPPGTYRLVVGWYDALTLQRLPVVSGPNAGADRVALSPVRVDWR